MKLLAVRPLADSAITLQLDDAPGAAAAARVNAALAAIHAEMEAGRLPGALEAIGAFASVTVHYDAERAAQADLVAKIRTLIEGAEPGEADSRGTWHLPCCYDGAHGADLDDLAQTLDLPRDEIIHRHAGATFDIFAMGFLPGLPFMGDLPEGLSLPRRASPRQRVPAGSVAIAKGLCVIYPWSSPGGWHIVGHCPVRLFDAARDAPALLAPGDRVRFDRVDEETHARITKDLDSGAVNPRDFFATAEEA